MGLYLSARELAQLDSAEKAFPSPVPTQIISNGEFNPLPQTPQQQQVEALIKELADQHGAKQGLDRRRFLRTSCGMAAAFVALNHVFGHLFDVSEAEAADPQRSAERTQALQHQFIFDAQTHFVHDKFDQKELLGLAIFAAEHWNPALTEKEKTDLIPAQYGVTNVYAEMGTSFANSCTANPRFAAALLGTWIKGMGVDHTVWGTDSVWYGSPQWQIEALRRLEIPEDMQQKWGFAPLGPANGPVKNQIFGYNSARLYNLSLRAEHPPLTQDNFAQIKEEYRLAGKLDELRDNAVYGFIAKRSA